MSDTDVADRIRAHLDELSPNDRRIARQLLDHYAQAPFETAESLATKVGVSKAAVVRFAVRVGFPGFSELHEALREEAVARLSGPAAVDGGGDVIDAVAERARTDLAAMRAGVDRRAFDEAVGMLTKGSGKIGIFGHRKSAALAEYAYYLLNPLLPNAWPIAAGEPGIADQLIDLEPRDRLIAFTFRRYAKVTAEVVRSFHEAGAIDAARHRRPDGSGLVAGDPRAGVRPGRRRGVRHGGAGHRAGGGAGRRDRLAGARPPRPQARPGGAAVEAVRHLLSARLLSGIVVAAAALAVLVLAAPPGPASVVAIGEPSTYTAPSSARRPRPRVPGLPGAVGRPGRHCHPDARRVAHRFAGAWSAGSAEGMVGLSDPVFRGRARGLSLVAGGPGSAARARVVGIGHDPLAGPLGRRCGPQALTLMRVVQLRGTSVSRSTLQVYVVWRPDGSRVWALR